MTKSRDPQEQALIDAIDEAHRFIERALRALAVSSGDHWCWPRAEKATAKRASMDLTRALAKFRRT